MVVILAVLSLIIGSHQFQLVHPGCICQPEIPGRFDSPYLADALEPDIGTKLFAPGRDNQQFFDLGSEKALDFDV